MSLARLHLTWDDYSTSVEWSGECNESNMMISWYLSSTHISPISSIYHHHNHNHNHHHHHHHHNHHHHSHHSHCHHHPAPQHGLHCITTVNMSMCMSEVPKPLTPKLSHVGSLPCNSSQYLANFEKESTNKNETHIMKYETSWNTTILKQHHWKSPEITHPWYHPSIHLSPAWNFPWGICQGTTTTEVQGHGWPLATEEPSSLSWMVLVLLDILVSVPSRELTYPTWGKGKSSSKVPFLGICWFPGG